MLPCQTTKVHSCKIYIVHFSVIANLLKLTKIEICNFNPPSDGLSIDRYVYQYCAERFVLTHCVQTRRSQTEHLVRTAPVSSAAHLLLRKSIEQFSAPDLAMRPYSVQWVSLSGSPRVMPCGASKRDTGAER